MEDRKSMEEAAPVRIARSGPKLPVATVTVFRDRAEVTRLCEFEAESLGTHEVVFEGLTQHMNLDSTRVKGTGRFTIQEVTYGITKLKLDREADDQDAEGAESKGSDAEDAGEALRSELRTLGDRVAELQQLRRVVLRGHSLFDAYTSKVLDPAVRKVATVGAPAAAAAAACITGGGGAGGHRGRGKAFARQLRMEAAQRAVQDTAEAAPREVGEAPSDCFDLDDGGVDEADFDDCDDALGLKPDGQKTAGPMPAAPPVPGSGRAATSTSTTAPGVGVPADLGFVTSVLDEHSARSRKAIADTAAVDAELRDLDDRIKQLKARLAAAGASTKKSDKPIEPTHEVVVTINVHELGSVSLLLTYMVTNAGWAPSYDIRISSRDGASNLSLTYNAQVQQSSGEDWNGAKLVLSTAEPAVGGSAPPLPTHIVNLSPYPIGGYRYQNMKAAKGGSFFGFGGGGETIPTIGFNGQAFGQERMMTADVLSAAAGGGSASHAATRHQWAYMATASVATGRRGMASGVASTFAIERRATIASDNKPHKVTVAWLTLTSRFRHFAAPSMSQNTYLQAITANTSDYTLLASSKVSVFLDGSFVSTSTMPSVAPGESFRTFVGVDPAVRVTTRPVSTVSERSGIFSRVDTVTYTRIIGVKNTKSIPVQVIVADVLPRACDTRVKVRALNPSEAELDAGSKIEEADAARAVAAEFAGGDMDAEASGFMYEALAIDIGGGGGDGDGDRAADGAARGRASISGGGGAKDAVWPADEDDVSVASTDPLDVADPDRPDRAEGAAAAGAGTGAAVAVAAGSAGAAEVRTRRATNRVARNPVTGNVVWQRIVPAGGSDRIEYQYAIEYPAGQHISVSPQ